MKSQEELQDLLKEAYAQKMKEFRGPGLSHLLSLPALASWNKSSAVGGMNQVGTYLDRLDDNPNDWKNTFDNKALRERSFIWHEILDICQIEGVGTKELIGVLPYLMQQAYIDTQMERGSSGVWIGKLSTRKLESLTGHTLTHCRLMECFLSSKADLISSSEFSNKKQEELGLLCDTFARLFLNDPPIASVAYYVGTSDSIREELAKQRKRVGLSVNTRVVSDEAMEPVKEWLTNKIVRLTEDLMGRKNTTMPYPGFEQLWTGIEEVSLKTVVAKVKETKRNKAPQMETKSSPRTPRM